MRHLAPALLLVLAPTAVQAAPFQDLDALDRRIAVALGADIGQPGGAATPLDRRLKLAACPTPPTVEPGLAGTAAVRCAAAGWRVAVRLVSGGATAAAAPGFARARAAPVIRRGDPVEMAVETDSFAVTLSAVADQDGAPGDRIRVHTDGRGGARLAEVVDAGRVVVPGFK